MKIKKLRIFLIIILIIQLLIPTSCFAGTEMIQIQLDTIKEVGEGHISNNFRIEYALKKYGVELGKSSNGTTKFTEWYEAIGKLINETMDGNGDYISNEGSKAYSLITSAFASNEKKKKIKSYTEESYKGLVGFILNLEFFMDKSGGLDLKSLPAEVFIDIVKECVAVCFPGYNIWNKIKSDFAKGNIEGYQNYMKETYGELKKTIYYAESARRTYFAINELADGKWELGGSLSSLKEYNKEEITAYYEKYGYNYCFSKENNNFEIDRNRLEAIWYKKVFNIEESEYVNPKDAHTKMREYARSVIQGNANAMTDGISEGKFDSDSTKNYQMPENQTADRTSNPSGVVEDAEAFVTTDSDNPYEQSYLKTESLQEFSQTLYSVLLGIGIVLAVIIGLILGIKFMLASVAEKAQVKKLLVTYAIGCAVVFGAFGIWKLVVEIMQNI